MKGAVIVAGTVAGALFGASIPIPGISEGSNVSEIAQRAVEWSILGGVIWLNAVRPLEKRLAEIVSIIGETE